MKTFTTFVFSIATVVLTNFLVGQQAGPSAEKPGFVGIAISTSSNQQFATITDVYPASAAARAGIRSGDVVKAIGSTILHGTETGSEIQRLLAGGEGAELVLTLERAGVEEAIRITINRDSWPKGIPPPPRRDLEGIRTELESMLSSDQEHRSKIRSLEEQYGLDSPEVKATGELQREIDLKNMRRLSEIIAEYGWPLQSEVGPDAALGAFLVLQHAELAEQKKHLPSVRKAAEAGELSRRYMALLEDRILVREGKKQLYGTQLRRNDAGKFELFPVEDEARLDERRGSMGLEPIAEYLERFNTKKGEVK